MISVRSMVRGHSFPPYRPASQNIYCSKYLFCQIHSGAYSRGRQVCSGKRVPDLSHGETAAPVACGKHSAAIIQKRSQAVKTADFDSAIRWFKSSRFCHADIALMVEQLLRKQKVQSSSLCVSSICWSSSAGRAADLYSVGRGFESVLQLHTDD